MNIENQTRPGQEASKSRHSKLRTPSGSVELRPGERPRYVHTLELRTCELSVQWIKTSRSVVLPSLILPTTKATPTTQKDKNLSRSHGVMKTRKRGVFYKGQVSKNGPEFDSFSNKPTN